MIIPVVMLCVWSVLFSTFWKRKQAVLRVRWGMTKYAKKEVKRPQFVGMWSLSSVTGEVREHQRKSTQRAKITSSVSVVVLYICITCVCVALLMWHNLNEKKRDPNTPTSIWVGIVNALQIKVFDAIYYYTSIYLNDWEN